MKKLLLALLIALSLIGFGKTRMFEEIPENLIKNFDKMGVNDDAYLNSFESDYFNFILQDKRGEFDFTGKKIGFVTGNGHSIVSKQSYFNIEKSRKEIGYSTNQAFLHLFNKSEKYTSGGYEGVVVYWVKAFLKSKSLPRRLKEYDSNN
jgi:hypothetical protein